VRCETGGEEFVVVPAAGGGWGAVTVALARRFRTVGPGGRSVYAILELDDEDRNVYVQAHVEAGGSIHAEVVSDAYLLPEDQLTPHQIALLEGHGWHLGWSESDDIANWCQEFNGDDRTDVAAAHMVFALSDVLGVRADEPVALRIFAAHDDDIDSTPLI